MTNEAIKALMVFALYGILEIVLCFSSVDKLKAALTVKTRRAVE